MMIDGIPAPDPSIFYQKDIIDLEMMIWCQKPQMGDFWGLHWFILGLFNCLTATSPIN